MTAKAPVLLNEKQRTKSFGFVQQVMEEKRLERVAATAQKAGYADDHLETLQTSDLKSVKSNLQKGVLTALFTFNASGLKQNLQNMKKVGAVLDSRKNTNTLTV